MVSSLQVRVAARPAMYNIDVQPLYVHTRRISSPCTPTGNDSDQRWLAHVHDGSDHVLLIASDMEPHIQGSLIE
jgi:hypothetical protein